MQGGQAGLSGVNRSLINVAGCLNMQTESQIGFNVVRTELIALPHKVIPSPMYVVEYSATNHNPDN